MSAAATPPNLPVAQAEEVREVPIGGVAAALIVERVDFHEENFLHERKLRGEPNLLRNPDAFEISPSAPHALHPTILARVSTNGRGVCARQKSRQFPK